MKKTIFQVKGFEFSPEPKYCTASEPTTPSRHFRIFLDLKGQQCYKMTCNLTIEWINWNGLVAVWQYEPFDEQKKPFKSLMVYLPFSVAGFIYHLIIFTI